MSTKKPTKGVKAADIQKSKDAQKGVSPSKNNGKAHELSSPEKDFEHFPRTKNPLYNVSDSEEEKQNSNSKPTAMTTGPKLSKFAKEKDEKPKKKVENPSSRPPTGKTMQAGTKGLTQKSEPRAASSAKPKGKETSKKLPVTAEEAKTTSRSVDKKKTTKVPKKKSTEGKSEKAEKNMPKSIDEEVSERKSLLMNLELLNKQMFESQETLKVQNSLLAKFNNLKQYINSFDYTIDKIVLKSENDDFAVQSASLLESVRDISSKLPLFSKEVKDIQYLKEENKNLNCKLELITIDKNDEDVFLENKLRSMRKIILNEMTLVYDTLKDVGIPLDIGIPNLRDFDEAQIPAFFRNLRKTMNILEVEIKEKDREIELITQDNKAKNEDLEMKKSKVEHFDKKKMEDLDNEINHYKKIVKNYEEKLFGSPNQIEQSGVYAQTHQTQRQDQSQEQDRGYGYSSSYSRGFPQGRDQADMYSSRSSFNNQTASGYASIDNFKRSRDMRQSEYADYGTSLYKNY